MHWMKVKYKNFLILDNFLKKIINSARIYKVQSY